MARSVVAGHPLATVRFWSLCGLPCLSEPARTVYSKLLPERLEMFPQPVKDKRPISPQSLRRSISMRIAFVRSHGPTSFAMMPSLSSGCSCGGAKMRSKATAIRYESCGIWTSRVARGSIWRPYRVIPEFTKIQVVRHLNFSRSSSHMRAIWVHQSAGMWAVLSMFSSIPMQLHDKLNGNEIHRLENIVTLETSIHAEFDHLFTVFGLRRCNGCVSQAGPLRVVTGPS
jgi:hypothetical protein